MHTTAMAPTSVLCVAIQNQIPTRVVVLTYSVPVTQKPNTQPASKFVYTGGKLTLVCKPVDP